MASPTLESFCCSFDNVTNHTALVQNLKRDEIIFNTYNVICIVSACLSIIGAIYQAWPRDGGTTRPNWGKRILAGDSQAKIIFWLAVSDVFACIGILLRSALWVGDLSHIETLLNYSRPEFSLVFCAVSSSWIQYFYVCTYFWTFNYALDVYFVIKGTASKPWLYHLLGWIVPVVLCIGGVVPLYAPSLWRCEFKTSHLLPHYLSTYLPILFVMIVNPVLYVIASKSVRQVITARKAHYTDEERKIVQYVKERFILVMSVFYLCWLPNIVNGILLLAHSVNEKNTLWKDRNRDAFHDVLLAFWMIMAVLNPLQALLNSIVYRGCGSCNLRCPKFTAEPITDSTGSGQASVKFHRSGETEPLLQYR